MSAILFIHGFATGPDIWKEQIREFSKDYHVFTDLEHIDGSEKVFVVGWSMGGWEAIDLCLEHHHKIRGLVLVSAFPKYVRSNDYPCGTPLSLLRKLEKKFVADYKDGMHYFYNLIFKDKKQHCFIDRLPAPEKEDIIRCFDRLKHEDKRDLLSKIDVSVLLIHGDQDPIVSPATAKYMRERIKDAELIVFAGVGHAPFLEEQEKFDQIVRRFLIKHED